jgi:hypothetical protein
MTVGLKRAGTPIALTANITILQSLVIIAVIAQTAYVVDFTINSETLVPVKNLIIETKGTIVADGKRIRKPEPLQGACWFIIIGHLAYETYSIQKGVVPISVGVVICNTARSNKPTTSGIK